MDKYKTTSTLEGLFDFKDGDSIQITSFSHTSIHIEGTEEYILSILVTRSAEKNGDKTAENAAEKPASGKHPAGIIIP